MKRTIVCAAWTVLFAASTGCSNDQKTQGPQAVKPRTGTAGMALETVSSSGKTYRLKNARFPIFSLSAGGSQAELDSDTDPSKAVLEAFLAPGSYETRLLPGWVLEQVDELLGVSAPVNAKLVSNELQTFDIQSDEETFVRFEFDVNGSQVVFGPPGRLSVGIGIHEADAGAGGGLNPRRSLLETNQTAVGLFSLSAALAALETNSGLTNDPNLLYRQIIDSYASAPNGKEPTAVHCGDETSGGAPSLNGFPIRCDRLEARQIENLGQWFPTAAVNRLDLAPTDGSHCGQQRLIFANNVPIGNGRMFMILEAQIPNPHPECGVAACSPLADFWAKLSSVDDPKERGARLVGAFLNGDPDLTAAGFAPFINANNIGVGTGSIRTNNFDDSEWTLRQFKILRESGSARAVPFPDVDAPHGALWNDTASLPEGPGCRQSFLTAVDSLLSDDPAEMAFPVDDTCYDAESPNDFTTQNYPQHLASGSGSFRSELVNRLAATGLTPEDIAARAQFAGSCMGCHEEANGLSLGHGVTAPFSNGFVQIDEEFTENCGDGTLCFTASPALTKVFLPHRLQVLKTVLGRSGCGTAPPDGGVAVPPLSEGGAAPAPDAGAALPTAGKSLSQLVQEDQSQHDKLAGQTTLGGQSASVTH